jgi:glycosyl transferase, family 25
MSTAANTDIHVFYLNRDKDVARRKALEAGLARHGLTGERITAVEGVALPPSLRAQFFNGDRLAAPLSPGEVGCYASHLLAMTLVVERNLSHAVILEDDAILTDDFVACTRRALQQAPSGWGLIQMCRTPAHAVKSVAKLPNGHELVRCSRLPTNAQGYLASNVGATKFTAARKRYWPVDVDFQQPWKFDIVPAVVRHEFEFESTIQKQGARLAEKRSFRMPTYYCWTGNPLRTPAGFIYNVRKLGVRNWLECMVENRKRRIAREISKLRPSAGRPGPGRD